ncbi:MAG TPA: DUF3800 domain-containing protein [Dehalococcoidia bacterium]
MTVKLYAFADESGIEGTGAYCIIAGYIGSPRQWDNLRHAWQAVLVKYGVPEFKAIDVFQPARWVHRPHFRDWSEARMQTFLGELLSIIDRRRIDPIGGALHVPAWNALTHNQRRFFTGGMLGTKAVIYADGSVRVTPKFKTSGAPSRPYMGVFQAFVGEALEKTPTGAVVNFVFDRQNVIESRAVETFHELFKNGQLPDELKAKLGDITYADSHREEPLQAADLYAYFWNRFLGRSVRGALLRQVGDSVSGKKHRMKVFHREHFNAMWNQLATDQAETIQSAVEKAGFKMGGRIRLEKFP